MGENHASFRLGWDHFDHIFTLRQISEQRYTFHKPTTSAPGARLNRLYSCFVALSVKYMPQKFVSAYEQRKLRWFFWRSFIRVRRGKVNVRYIFPLLILLHFRKWDHNGSPSPRETSLVNTCPDDKLPDLGNLVLLSKNRSEMQVLIVFIAVFRILFASSDFKIQLRDWLSLKAKLVLSKEMLYEVDKFIYTDGRFSPGSPTSDKVPLRMRQVTRSSLLNLL